MAEGWIGVDLDGTLAYDVTGNAAAGIIGDPIPAMLVRVKRWLENGIKVRIFTARVSGEDFAWVIQNRKNIEVWCVKHVGRTLPVTCMKDYDMLEYWDDRAEQVEPNTGRVRSPGWEGDDPDPDYVVMPRHPTPEMKIAGARSIRDTMHAPNFTERSTQCYAAHVDARPGK